MTDEAAILRGCYISRGIFHRKYIADALHVAIASYHKTIIWSLGILGISPMFAGKRESDSLTLLRAFMFQ